MKHYHLRVLLSLVLLCCIVCTLSAQQQLQLFTPSNKPMEVQLHHAAEFIKVDRGVFASAQTLSVGQMIRVTVPLPDHGNVTAVVSKFEVFSSTATIIAETKNGKVNVARPVSLLLRGFIPSIPGSYIMLAVYSDWCTGYISVPSGTETKRYLVSPLKEIGNTEGGIAGQTMIVYDEFYGVHPQAWHCAVTDEGVVQPRKKNGAAQTQATYANVELAIEADYDMYLDHGGNTTKTTEYAEAVVAASSAIYSRDVNASFTIVYYKLWTVADPYTGTTSSTLLSQYRTYWRNNNNGIARDISTLLSGINSIGGVAYLDGMCGTNQGYSICGLNNNITYPATGYAWDTDVVSHELGHNIGSPHTHSCTWSPAIDSCYAAEGSCFSGTKARQGTVMSYCHLTTFGTSLEFHPTVQTLLKSKLQGGACVAMIAATTVNAGKDTTICNGASVQLTATVSGGVSPYTFVWTPTTGMTGSTTATPTVTPTVTTSYIVEARDKNSVLAKDTVKVTVNSLITIAMPGKDSICAGTVRAYTSSVVGGTLPYTFSWRQDTSTYVTTSASITFAPQKTGMLYLTATDAKGCKRTDSVNIKVFEKPIVSITNNDQLLCPSTLTTLEAVPTAGRAPFTYTWYENTFRVANTLPQHVSVPATTTTYRVIIVDLNGCADTAERQVTVRSISGKTIPSTLPIPNLAVCDDGFSATVAIENTGADTIVISSVKTGTVVVQTSDLPTTIFPGQQKTIAMFIKPNAAGQITDTIVFAESICNKKFTTILSGKVGGFVLTSSIPADFPATTFCVTPAPRRTSVTVSNTTGQPVTMLTVSSAKFPGLVTYGTTDLTIAPNTVKSVLLLANVSVPEGVFNDTLKLNFLTGSCQSSLNVPAKFTTTKLTVSIPELISFNTVAAQNSPSVTRSFTIHPVVTGLSSVVVSAVTITPPFTTKLTPGTILTTNADNTFTAQFNPSLATKVGNITGTLTLRLDSCGTDYAVALFARIGIVSGVDTEGEDEFDRMLTVHHNEIVTGDVIANLRVLDLRGALMLERNIEGKSTIDISNIPSGVYVVMIRRDLEVHSRIISLIR